MVVVPAELDILNLIFKLEVEFEIVQVQKELAKDAAIREAQVEYIQVFQDKFDHETSALMVIFHL